jgi:hypothetical protein
MPNGTPFQRISQRKLRVYFNEWDYAGKVVSGEFVAMVYRERPPGNKAPPMPIGSVSQEVHYFDRRMRRRAIVHQYLQPDGTLGASGKPDPKYLMGDDGTIYALPKRGSAS